MSEGKNKGGRRPLLDEEHATVLRAITTEQPRSSLEEVTRELGRRTGMNVCTVTVRKALRHAGIERMKPLRKPTARGRYKGARRCAWATPPRTGARTVPAA